MTTNGTITVLDPTVEPIPAHAVVAPRPTTLDGAVVGLLSNGKPYAAGLLRDVHAILADRFQFKAMVERNKGDSSRPSPRSILEDLARECDVVVTAIGD